VFDYGTRSRVQAVCGEERLQAWAVALLHRPEAEWPLGDQKWVYGPEEVALDPSKLPRSVQNLLLPTDSPVMVSRGKIDAPVVLVRGSDGVGKYIRISFVDPAMHIGWGVIVGETSLKMDG